MAEKPVIGFRPVVAADYPMLDGWLRLPHMREWWGDSEDELGYIRDMVEGRDTTRPYIITLDGEAIGYIQVWFVGDHQDDAWLKDNPWLSALPPETVGVDLSIGRPELLSQGIGSAAVKMFVARLREEGFETIIIDPDPANKRAVRAYEKAGFKPVPALAGKTDGVLIMQYSSETSETEQ